jgi:hypothetical protein
MPPDDSADTLRLRRGEVGGVHEGTVAMRAQADNE